MIQIFGKAICESSDFVISISRKYKSGSGLHVSTPPPPNRSSQHHTTTSSPLRHVKSVNPRSTDKNELLISSLACIHDLLSKCKLKGKLLPKNHPIGKVLCFIIIQSQTTFYSLPVSQDGDHRKLIFANKNNIFFTETTTNGKFLLSVCII